MDLKKPIYTYIVWPERVLDVELSNLDDLDR